MPEYDYFKSGKAVSSCGCTEFSTDLDDNTQTYDNYTNKGVELDREGGSLILTYKGLLAKSGAQDLYAVFSYGDNKNWNNVQSLPMDQVDRGRFETVLSVNQNMNLNVVFKDGAGNWDNNSGKNYSYNAH